MKLYKCLTITDLTYLYEQDEYFKDKIDDKFCRKFTKLLSFIMYDVINKNKDVYIIKRKDSTHFYMKGIDYKDIYRLRTINMIKEKDILIRINQELKQKVKDKAKSLGLSVSSYIRLLLIKELENE